MSTITKNTLSTNDEIISSQATTTSQLPDVIHSVAYGNGVFVAISKSPTQSSIYYSTNGFDWQTITNPGEQTLTGYTYTNIIYAKGPPNYFIFIQTETGKLFYSEDGIKWLCQSTSSTNSKRLNSVHIATNDNIIMAARRGEANAITLCQYSTMNGWLLGTWIESSIPVNGFSDGADLVAYGGSGYFMIVNGKSGYYAISSDEGKTWSSDTIYIGVNKTFHDLIAADGVFILAEENILLTMENGSSDGANWQHRTQYVPFSNLMAVNGFLYAAKSGSSYNDNELYKIRLDNWTSTFFNTGYEIVTASIAANGHIYFFNQPQLNQTKTQVNRTTIDYNQFLPTYKYYNSNLENIGGTLPQLFGNSTFPHFYIGKYKGNGIEINEQQYFTFYVPFKPKFIIGYTDSYYSFASSKSKVTFFTATLYDNLTNIALYNNSGLDNIADCAWDADTNQLKIYTVTNPSALNFVNFEYTYFAI